MAGRSFSRPAPASGHRFRATRIRSGGNPERGSIAILALWGVTLVFMLLAPVAFATRGELQITRNALAASRARLAAEAGTQLGLLRLLRQHESRTVAVDGRPEAWQQGSTKVAIAISDEAGKIDLNVAPLELLVGLFEAVGEPRETAELLGCNVLDRRGDSGTGCPEPDGSQPGRRFVLPEELAELPGIDDRLYERVADCVTVATGASAIDPTVASRTVLMAIPGATDGLVDAFLESRATLRDFGAEEANLLPSATPFVMASPGRDFTIAATATTSEGARYRAELQVRLTGRAAQPYQVVAWRTPPADRGVIATAKTRWAP
jgi:general secretion pathway protein K